MWKNYLTVAWRNILRHKIFSLINISGLALGMSICMLIILMFSDQKSFDRFHQNKDRIYRILSDEDNSKAPNAVTAFPLAPTLESDYSVVDGSTRLTRGLNAEIHYNGNTTELNGYFADNSFFKVFSFELAQGDAQTALKSPNSMVISQSMAEKLFLDENPVSKTVELIDLRDVQDTLAKSWGVFTITGVISDKDYKSHLLFDVLVSSSSIHSLVQANKLGDFVTNWKSSPSYSYVLLAPEKGEKDLSNALDDLVSRQYVGEETPAGFKLMGQALIEINPGIIVRNETRSSLPRLAYYFLSLLGLLILFSACLNYTNLSLAKSLSRAKEIGVRKVTGANKKNLALQFLSESLITALLALICSIALLFIIKPAFKGLSFNQYLNFDLRENVLVVLIFIGFSLLIGFLAGLYPALVMSSFSPIKALNKLYQGSTGKLGFRKVLSTFQFVISLFFIITTLLIYQQFKHYLEFEYGFNSDNIVNVTLQGNNYDKVASEFLKVPGVYTISASDIIPATDTENALSLKHVGVEEDYRQTNILITDSNFIENLELEIIAGRNLPLAGMSPNSFVVVNEAMMREFGYQNPQEIVGQVFESKYGNAELEVIGVVEDFRFKMLVNDHDIGPLVLRNQPDEFNYVQVKMASTDLKGTVAALEEKWNEIDPLHPFEYDFFNDQLMAMYQVFFDMVSILGYIAFLALTIACLGLFAMAMHTTERRSKEIGLRKVMGANISDIFFLLSRGFIKIMLLAVLIGAPLSFVFNDFWLKDLPNRVDFGWGTLLLGSLMLLGLGLISIGSQTLKAAIRNPVDSLKAE